MIQLKTLNIASGESVKVTNQWAAECEKRGTTVSSSAWAFTGSGSIASEALATPVATCIVSPTTYGCLSNTVTLANGEVLTAYRKIEMGDCR